MKGPSSANVFDALVNFGYCCDSDIMLDTEKFRFNSMEDVARIKRKPQEGCFLSFVERLYECSPIANDHPFCREDHPSYNSISCAIKLNQCLLDSLSGIENDC